MNGLKRKLPTVLAIALVLCIGILYSLTGCGQVSKADANATDNIYLIATTTFLGDLAKNIGGDYVQVESLMGPGIDPHLYQASAGDVTKLQNADAVLYNGLHLEGKMGDVFESLSNQNYQVICIEDGLNTANLLPSEDGGTLYDPHIWFDVSLWKDAATHVAEQLAKIDGEHADEYAANLTAYLAELEGLETYIWNRVEELPEDQRILITAHDAFRYFGNTYGFEVKGLQGISTDAEAGTADVSELASYIAQYRVKAVFIESSVPPKTIEALQAAVSSKGFETVIGGELYSDSLGDAASGTDTYIGTLRANIDTIIDGLK